MSKEELQNLYQNLYDEFQLFICKSYNPTQKIELIDSEGKFYAPFVMPRLITFCNKNYDLVSSLYKILDFTSGDDWEALLSDYDGYIDYEGLDANDIEFLRELFGVTLK